MRWEPIKENFITKYFRENFRNEAGEYQYQSPVYNWLNGDNLGAIRADAKTKVFWLELTTSTATLPAYALKHIKQFMKKRGYTYLYD